MRNRIKNRKLVALYIHLLHQHTEVKVDSPIKETLPAVGTFPIGPNSTSQQLVSRLNKALKSENIYLQNNFTLQKAADLLGSNRTYLSNAVNEVLNQNFSAYINELRIIEAIRLISYQCNPNDINISGLVSDVGFSSRTSFIAAFKKQTGMLPSTFIANYKDILNNRNLVVDFET